MTSRRLALALLLPQPAFALPRLVPAEAADLIVTKMRSRGNSRRSAFQNPVQ